VETLGDKEFAGTGRFQVLGRLGAGAMGVVYEVRDIETERKLALKTLRYLDGAALLRFKTEFRALADLNHPNLVSLGELVEERGEWFFTMELVPGCDFMSYVRGAATLISDTIVDDLQPTEVSPTDATARMSLAHGDWANDSPRSAGYDEARLRRALVQVARGLLALHEAGKVHRDVKPANIRVSPEGRVVILDFGLVSDVKAIDRTTGDRVVGTVAYMAPEQAAAERVGPEADWYAVGTILYEALTGKLPFAGAGLQALLDKQLSDPPAPSTVVAEVPGDLESLCMALLSREASKRPTGIDVLAWLGAEEDDVSPTALTSTGRRPPFVGRTSELALLESAFQETKERKAVAVLLTGESGVGKSMLVRRFLEELRAQEPRTAILSSRCYERESVPYKAVDGVIDSLSRFMGRLSAADAGALLPRQAGLLVEVFPVLGRVRGFTKVMRYQGEIDPQELRTRLFDAVRETLGRLADRLPVVVAIDDLHWADEDSLRLLREILREPEAPSLLLLAAARPERKGDLRALAPERMREIVLDALPEEDALALARRLLGGPAAEGGDAAMEIAREAAGHPLFIEELVRYRQVKAGRRAENLRFDEALLARISVLAPDAKRLLEVCSLAAGPLQQTVAATACALAPPEFASAVAFLRSERLARTSGARRADTIEPYHDRIRETVAGELSDRARRNHHRELARALEGSDPPGTPEVLATHWMGAGESQRATRCMIRAADAAAAALAFDRAARLYQSALGFLAEGTPERHSLTVKLGDALANAGRCEDAAEQYLVIASSAGPAEATTWRRKAAEQLLLGGHLDRGCAAFKAALDESGTPLVKSENALSHARSLWAELRGKNLAYRERAPVELDALGSARADVCWSAALGFTGADPEQGLVFSLRHLLLSLETGDPYRVARGCALLVVHAGGAWRSGSDTRKRYVALATEQATRLDDPYLNAWAALARGTASYYEGRMEEAIDAVDRAECLFRESCVGATREAALALVVLLQAHTLSGHVEEICQRLPALLSEADRRRDLFLAANLGVSSAFFYLADDHPRAALDSIQSALVRWNRDHFDLFSFFGLLSQTLVQLYQGEPGALATVESTHRRFSPSALATVHLYRAQFLLHRSSAALAAATNAAQSGQPDRAQDLLHRASSDIEDVAASQLPTFRQYVATNRAAVAFLSGDLEGSRAQLAEALTWAAAAQGNPVLYDVLRWRLGQLRGGSEGARQTRDAKAALSGRGLRNPEGWARMYTPGFPATEPFGNPFSL